MKKLIKFLIILAVSVGVVCLFWKPICQAFSVTYNFIQTNPLFTSNLFNFILVALFLWWLLFKKIDIIGLLDKKSKETAALISNSENKKTDAQKYLSDTQSSVKNTDSKVKNIIDEAKEISKNIETKSAQKLEEELQSIKNREQMLKKAQISKAKEEVSVVIANAAVALSKEYIQNSLDENTHKELIYNFINDLDEGMKL